VAGTPATSCSISNASESDYSEANACGGGTAYACYDLSPWSVCNTLSYGYAAVSFGTLQSTCGHCYQMQFTGPSSNAPGDQGSQTLVGKTMIVQAINNGGVSADQFDIMIPGGGVGANDACTTQWNTNTNDLGETYGGFLATCKQQSADYSTYKSCVLQKCTSMFGGSGMSSLMAGCNWFLNWYGAADDPAFTYTEVTCPSALTSNSGLHD